MSFAVKTKALLLPLLSIPFLASCGDVFTFKVGAGLVTAASYGVFSDPKVNLKEKNYAAADFLQSQINNDITPHHVILAHPLEEADHPGISSAFGRNIPEGIGLRFQELGYKVMLHEVAPYDNELLYPKPKGPVASHFVLKGTYAVKVRDVDVSLYIRNVKTGNVVGRFDYSMPLSHEIKKLAETEPRIFRVKKQ